MKSAELETKVKDAISKGAKASKEAFEKAGNKIQNFTDKSVLKIEIRQLENKRDCKFEELGLKISELLLKGLKLDFEDNSDLEIVNGLQQEIIELSSKISEKESELK
ncbi:MAG: hypothetical protein PUC37_08350 [Spirochaetales bacterium]|nr:hypothetical protein [Spirochaetales bacterium]